MKSELSFAGKMLMYHVMTLVIGLLVLWQIPVLWLQCVLNALLIAGYGWLLFNEGGMRGEAACTASATLGRMAEEGRAPDPALAAQAFNKRTPWLGYALGVLPLVLLTAVNLIVEPMYPPVVVPPASDAEIAAQIEAQLAAEQTAMPELPAETAQPQAAASETAPPAPDQTAAEPVDFGEINVVAVVTRLVFAMYVALITLLSQHPHALNLLFLLLAALVPLAMPIGYLQGPRLRQKKLEMIELGKKRKLKKLKVNQPKKGPRPPKMEV